MTFLWIILGIALMFFLSDYIWIILLALAVSLIVYYVLKAKREREEAERKWRINEAEKTYRKDPTHNIYLKTSVPNTHNAHTSINVTSAPTYNANPIPRSKEASKPEIDQNNKQAQQSYTQKTSVNHGSNSTITQILNSAVADPLASFVRYGITAPSIYQDCPMVYRYLNVSVSTVNRDSLKTLVKCKDFEVTLFKNESGDILLKKYGSTIAKLEDRVEMCSDWLDNGLPIICQFAAFANGKEKVALFFYKNQESALTNHKCEIVKLTSCMSASKQETISFLENGQKLFIDLDDNNKPYVRDIEYHPIGNLPAKYQKLYEEELICGVFFDHSETKHAEDFDKDDKEIPFVRIYLDE